MSLSEHCSDMKDSFNNSKILYIRSKGMARVDHSRLSSMLSSIFGNVSVYPASSVGDALCFLKRGEANKELPPVAVLSDVGIVAGANHYYLSKGSKGHDELDTTQLMLSALKADIPQKQNIPFYLVGVENNSVGKLPKGIDGILSQESGKFKLHKAQELSH